MIRVGVLPDLGYHAEALGADEAVALGAAEMSVAKLFSLSPSDVLTLDRGVDAPVDIRLNDKVIARGSLVAVGDNIGVRVTDILRE